MHNTSQELLGNNILINNLIRNFKNKSLHNSLIFSGSKGIGKKTTALFLIKNIYKYLLKNNYNHHINLIYNNAHPNIKYIYKEFDEKNNKYKNSINIEQIRNLENFIYQSPFNNLPKFILIDSADDLNKNSSNALLKILEEPKKNTYFILITHHISTLLPTLRSRCIKFFFKSPSFDYFKKIIINNKSDFNNDEIQFLYDLSNSSPGIALELLSENLKDDYLQIINILDDNYYISSEIIGLSNRVKDYSNQEYRIFLMILRFVLLTIIKIYLGVNLKNQLSSNLHKKLKITTSKITNNSCITILDYLNNNENDLFVYNLDKKIFCLNIFTSLSHN